MYLCPNMALVIEIASIIKKTIKGKAYYYFTESKWVDGKPKRVNQIYLGSAETILRKIESQKPMQPLYSEIEAFGDVCLIYDLAERLSLVEMLDNACQSEDRGKRVGPVEENIVAGPYG